MIDPSPIQTNQNIDQISQDIDDDDIQPIQEIKIGKIDSNIVQTTTEVDPSTKDDECASIFLASKFSKKAQQKKRMKKKSNVVKSTKNIDSRNEQVRSVDKISEIQLNMVNSISEKRINDIVNERSRLLFDGSEEKYNDFVKKLESLVKDKALNDLNIKNALQIFHDVAEQHNALQIVLNTYEQKLTNLQNSKNKNLKQVDKQINELKTNCNIIESVKTKLLENYGNRIIDSYTLAPFLKMATEQIKSGITLQPKSFNELILDKILPLNGDLSKTFNCLIHELVESFDNNEGSIDNLNKNIDIVKQCLTIELVSCKDQMALKAILSACKMTESLKTIQDLNKNLIQSTIELFKKN